MIADAMGAEIAYLPNRGEAEGKRPDRPQRPVPGARPEPDHPVGGCWRRARMSLSHRHRADPTKIIARSVASGMEPRPTSLTSSPGGCSPHPGWPIGPWPGKGQESRLRPTARCCADRDPSRAPPARSGHPADPAGRRRRDQDIRSSHFADRTASGL
jgi:hypothetical protein